MADCGERVGEGLLPRLDNLHTVSLVIGTYSTLYSLLMRTSIVIGTSIISVLGTSVVMSGTNHRGLIVDCGQRVGEGLLPGADVIPLI